MAKKYLEANEKAIKQIEKRIEKENIDCDFEKLTSYIYTDKKSYDITEPFNFLISQSL